MDKTQILNTVDSIKKEDVVFIINGKTAESRFNSDDGTEQKIQDNRETAVAFALYSILLNSIFLKAKGTQACNDALPTIRKFIDGYVRIEDERDVYGVEEKKEIFYQTVNSFIFGKEKKNMFSIFENLSGLVILKFSSESGEVDRKTYQILNKKKEIIFNQAVLFARALYRSILMHPDMDAFKIKTDVLAFDNPAFTYENRLVLPICEDAFTLKSLKEAIEKTVSSISERLDLSRCTALVVAYLLRDYLAEINL